jgi:hypothetical protein
VESSCELGNEPSGSIKCWETTERLHNLRPLEWYSTPQSQLVVLVLLCEQISRSVPSPVTGFLSWTQHSRIIHALSVMYNGHYSLTDCSRFCYVITEDYDIAIYCFRIMKQDGRSTAK